MPEKSNKVAVWFLLIAFCLASSSSQAAESLQSDDKASIVPAAADEAMTTPKETETSTRPKDSEQGLPWSGSLWIIFVIPFLILDGWLIYSFAKDWKKKKKE